MVLLVSYIMAEEKRRGKCYIDRATSRGGRKVLIIFCPYVQSGGDGCLLRQL